MRVPLVIRIPGRESGQVDATTRHIDLMPTLLALAGLEPESELSGQSLIPLLDGRTEDRKAFTETRPKPVERGEFARNRLRVPGVEGKIRSIRRQNYKLIVYPTAEGFETELYDLETDAGETRDLTKDLPEVSEKLLADLEAWFARYQDTEIAPLELDSEDLESLRTLGYID